jgi:hypothetical protein
MRKIRIGECIYCRTHAGSLGREHMVAAGLNGPWVLHEATCGTCADITSAFEAHVLGPVFRLARAGLRLRMSERPASLPLLIDRGDGAFVQVEVPLEEYPAVVQFPEFLPPAHLDGRAYTGGIQPNGVRTIQVAGPPANEVARRLAAKRIRWTTNFAGHTFLRLIAKVAYTFVVADVGLEGIATAYVVPGILGQSEDLGCWAGCDGVETIVDPSYLHGVSQQIVNDEVIVRVRLFARYQAPEYVVVVGRLHPGAPHGRFRASGPQGVTRTRTLADVQQNAQRAPDPSIPFNHALDVTVRRGE